MPTGVVVAGRELILYFGEFGPGLALASRDVETGQLSYGFGLPRTCGEQEPPFVTICQLADPNGGTIIDYGAVRAEAAEITVTEQGVVMAAAFARWRSDPAVAIFWLERTGDPIRDVEWTLEHRREPLAPERYPLVSVYDGTGAELAAARIRPGREEG